MTPPATLPGTTLEDRQRAHQRANERQIELLRAEIRRVQHEPQRAFNNETGDPEAALIP